jgi:hypothetical protein
MFTTRWQLGATEIFGPKADGMPCDLLRAAQAEFWTDNKTVVLFLLDSGFCGQVKTDCNSVNQSVKHNAQTSKPLSVPRQHGLALFRRHKPVDRLNECLCLTGQVRERFKVFQHVTQAGGQSSFDEACTIPSVLINQRNSQASVCYQFNIIRAVSQPHC